MAERGYSDVFPWPVIGIHSLLTPDGKVLTFGTNTSGVQSGELYYDVYDPVSGTHTTLQHTTKTDIFCCVAGIIPGTGKVLLAGGDARPLGAVNAGVPDVNVYDYQNMGIEASATGPMAYARWYASMVSLANGQLVALGGCDGNYKFNGYSEIYTDGIGWRTLTGAYIEDFNITSNYPRTWVASNGKIITFAAELGAATVYAIDPTGSGSVEVVGKLPFATSFSRPAIMFDVDRALILANDGTAWIMNISGDKPVFTRTDGVDPNRIWSNFELLPDGTVLLSGGSAVDNQIVGTNYSSAIWNPSTGHWADADDAAVPRLYHSTTLLLPDGTVLSLGGGAPGPVGNLNGEIFTPDYLSNASGAPADRPVILSAPDALEAGDHFTITVDDPGSIETLALLAFGTTTHSLNMSARRIELAFTKEANGTLSIDLPDNVNVLKPGYWMLFALDSNGVPSIASTIHIGVEQAPYMPSTLPLDLGVALKANGLAAYDGFTDAYVLTPDAAGKVGSVMSEQRIDLRETFSMSFEFNVGANDAAADGFAFVLHNDPAGAGALGAAGGALGALGIHNGLGIEFDIYQNSRAYLEPTADHTNVFDTDNLTSDPAVTTPTVLGNIEDGLWHQVHVVWNGTDTLSYTIDGMAAGSWTGDISSFLAESPFAYFGFTGATGGLTTQQRVKVLALDATGDNGTTLHADRGDLPIAPEIKVHGAAVFNALANEYVLTPDVQGARGSIAVEQKIDLSQSFKLVFQFNVGGNDAAADGLAFVLHNDPSGAGALGDGGGGLGAVGIKNGLGIEFDIYQNAQTATELANDHTVIFDTDAVGGDPTINSPTDLGNLEDDRWHTVEIIWNGHELQYSVDGFAISTLTADIAATYLGGSQSAFLGITAATGGATAEQKIRIVNFSATAQDGTALRVIGPGAESYDKPLARVDSYSVAEDGTLTITAADGVLANDADPNNDPLQAKLISGPAHGALTLRADGSFLYTPMANFNGVDKFTYRATDGATGSGAVTVSIAVAAVNDAPTMTLNGGLPLSIAVKENSSAVATITSNDVDGNPLSYSIVGGTDGALFSINPMTGALAFVTPPDFEAPADSDGDNIYNVVVQVSDGAGETDTQSIAVVVGNVDGANLTGNNAANTLIGTDENETISGLGGNDKLFGLAGNDTLDGGAGNDTLDGGAGADVMRGGAGNDTYIVDDVGDVVIEAAKGGTDTVLTRLSSFTLGSEVENLTFVGDGAFTGVGNILNNVIIGGSFNDTLFGDAGNDTLNGGAGDDILDGGTGKDTLVGGVGDDTYIVDTVGDVVTEGAAAGNDTVKTTLAAYTLGLNLENLTFIGTGAFSGTGNALNNTITGGAFADTLNGGAGADTLIGGLGNDTYIVDNAGDLVVEAANAGTDTVKTTLAAYTLGSDVENLTFTGSVAFAGFGNELGNVITGGAKNDFLFGGAGNDTLNGAAGNDTLVGGEGADTLLGGAGNDLYVVDDAGDVVIEAAKAGTDTVQTALAAYVLGLNVENLTFTGTTAFAGTGNALNNVITGGSGNDTLDGRAGADLLIGGLGDDLYIVDNVKDVVKEAANEGTDTVQTTLASYVLGANIEHLTYIGAAAFTGTGNALDNTITGGVGNDTLNGGLGADTLIGGAGNDTYVVDNAGDVVIESASSGADTVKATIGFYALTANVENLAFTGTGSFTGVGNDLDNVISGGAQDDTLYGNGGNDTLSGGSGADRIDGGTGADKMIGGSGNDLFIVDDIGDVVIENAGGGTDTVETSLTNYVLGANVENLTFTGTGSFTGTGNSAANTITGGAGADTLNGGAGNDRIIGGAGNDILFGGAGNDTFVFNPGFGNDVIADFGDVTNNDDILQFSTSVFADFAAVELAATQVGADIVITVTGSDSLTIKNKTIATLNANDFQFV